MIFFTSLIEVDLRMHYCAECKIEKKESMTHQQGRSYYWEHWGHVLCVCCSNQGEFKVNSLRSSPLSHLLYAYRLFCSGIDYSCTWNLQSFLKQFNFALKETVKHFFYPLTVDFVGLMTRPHKLGENIFSSWLVCVSFVSMRFVLPTNLFFVFCFQKPSCFSPEQIFSNITCNPTT